MRGRVDPQESLFSYFSPESRVPEDHPLRRIKQHADTVLASMFRGSTKLARCEHYEPGKEMRLNSETQRSGRASGGDRHAQSPRVHEPA